MMREAGDESMRIIMRSALEFAEGSGGAARARVMRDKWPEMDRRTWEQIVALGWPLATVAEAHGGLELGLEGIATLAESTSRMLLPEPLVANMAAAGLLSACGGDAAQALLGEMVAGRRLAVPVFQVARGRAPFVFEHVPDCYPGTTLLIAQDTGKRFCIRALGIDAGGVTLQSAASVDGSVLSRVEVDAAAWEGAAQLAEGRDARAAFAQARDTLLIGYAASLVGVMDEALQQTIDYMKVRNQFGMPIGGFQALQHRAASCYVDIQAARAMVYEACKASDVSQRARAAAAAKARASAAALRVTKECVQFHGAIGFADEHDIGLYLKKAVALAARFGGEMQQRARYAQFLLSRH